MDKIKAKELESSLKGTIVGGFKVIKLVDHGKSAAVFFAEKGEAKYALKVFDDELISRYGDKAQFQRIEREIELKDSPHPNLVNIICGGICAVTNNHFIVMEFVDGYNLKKCLSQINQEDIWHYISQLVSAAKHLDDLGYVHRDIKPENIMINLEKRELTLMDLGVIKPYKGADLTDSDGIMHFLGTLQYSSPEFLLREEEDSQDGWRALTFYQIGAVLHDMIMGIPIFQEESEPYGRLVVAVNDSVPTIESDNVDQDLIHLAKCCLIKKPEPRLNLVTWDSFYPAEASDSAKSRILRKIELIKSSHNKMDEPSDEESIKNELHHRIIDVLKTSLRVILAGNPLVPKVSVTSKNDDILLLRFCEAKEIGILNEFIICIKLEIIYPSAEAISIKYSVSNHDRENLLDGTLFKGAYDKEKIIHKYEEVVYKAMESMMKESNNG